MTSVLSTLNPLFEKNQTLTKSIYTSFNRSTREGVKKDSANSLVNTDETESLHYNNDNLVFDSTSGPSTVIISSEGNITTKGSINVDGVINGTCSNALHANTADSVTDIDPSLITQIENQVITKCDDKYMKNNITSLSLDELTVNSSSGTPALKITTETLTGTTEPNVLFMYSNGSSTRTIMAMNNDRIYSAKPMAFPFGGGIQFNTQDNGNVSWNDLPQTILMNLVPSTINETQLSYMKTMLDCICPTYQYCENTYAKTDDVDSIYETLDTKVNNTDLTTNYYTKTEVDAKIESSSGIHQKHILNDKLTTTTTSIKDSKNLTDLAKMNVNSKVQSGCWNINFRIILSLTSSLDNLLPLSQGLMFCLRRKTSNGTFQNTQLLGSSMGMYFLDRKLEFRILGTIDDIFDSSIDGTEITSDEFILSYSNSTSISITNTDTTYNWIVESPEQTFIKL